MATYPRRSERDEPVALDFQSRHPLLSLQSGSRTDVEVDAVLGDLVLRNLLEEQPWAVPVRVRTRSPTRMVRKPSVTMSV